MSNLHVKYLLVGGGLASLSAARAIRSIDSEGAVLMVAQEASRPYHRSPLSKQYLRKEMRRNELFAEGPDWFLRAGVELRTGRRVSRLDIARQTAVLDNGEEVSFDGLLLATGASPAPLTVPGARLPNVLYLRSVEDVGILHNAIDKARHEGRPHPAGGTSSVGRGKAVVSGAGLLGVEAAASLRSMGLWVDLLAERSHPWDQFAGEATGRSLQMHLTQEGVAVHPFSPVRRIEGDGRVQRVVIDTGTIDCDFVVVCVGSVANKDITRGTPIASGNAIVVDEHCRTNVPGVWAAGDCCALLDPRFGKHRSIEHAEDAVETGALAGRNMTGAAETYSAVNHYTSEVLNLKLEVWGEPRVIDRRVIRARPGAEAPDFIEVGVAADGRIAQVLVVGHRSQPTDPLVFRELVSRRVRLNGNEERLKDPWYPIEDLLR